MPSQTYGSRLLNAQDMLSSLQNLQNYAAADPEQTTPNFSAFLALVKQANDAQSAVMQQYRWAVKARSDAFSSENSIKTLLPKIRAAVHSQYGKQSQQYNAVSSIINKTQPKSGKSRALALIPPPADATHPTAAKSKAVANAVSRSQKSFGSVLGHFNALIQTLSQMKDYAPVNADLSVANLQAFSQNLDTLNNNVAASLHNLQQQRAARGTFYSNLSARSLQIKANIKSQYGQKSAEYKVVKGLQV